MALDEAILHAVSMGVSPPTFRLFEWEPSAVTLGFSQKGGAGIDCERCEADGITVTRRLTGGRAVFHAGETAYSVIGPLDDPAFGGSIMDTYREISGSFSMRYPPSEYERNGAVGRPRTPPRRLRRTEPRPVYERFPL